MPAKAKPGNLKLGILNGGNGHHDAPGGSFPGIRFTHRRGDSGIVIGDA